MQSPFSPCLSISVSLLSVRLLSLFVSFCLSDLSPFIASPSRCHSVPLSLSIPFVFVSCVFALLSMCLSSCFISIPLSSCLSLSGPWSIRAFSFSPRLFVSLNPFVPAFRLLFFLFLFAFRGPQGRVRRRVFCVSPGSSFSPNGGAALSN